VSLCGAKNLKIGRVTDALRNAVGSDGISIKPSTRLTHLIPNTQNNQNLRLLMPADLPLGKHVTATSSWPTT